jgi:hypothetical protein
MRRSMRAMAEPALGKIVGHWEKLKFVVSHHA